MNYEQKYNEALERAIDKFGKDSFTVKTIFPELRESEDERIRQEIIDFVLYKPKGSPTDEEQDRWVAWLETQKDRMAPIYEDRDSFESALEKAWNDYHNGYEKVDSLEDDYVECAHAKGFREGFLFGVEKQKEQKSVDYEAELKKCKDNPLYFYDKYVSIKQKPAESVKPSGKLSRQEYLYQLMIDNIISLSDYTYLTEQKPAEWSDTNELVFQDICNHLKEEGYGGWVLFLKALRNEKFPPKQKWGEEDEKMINDCIHAIEYELIDNGQDEQVATDPRIAFLKSLPERFSIQPIQEWSNDDQLRRNICACACKAVMEDYPDSADHYKKGLDWLENLQPQPKQEWSEEDEKMFEQVVDVVYDYCPDPVAKYKLKDWLMQRLKSLKPQQNPEWNEEDEDFINMLILHFNYLIDKGGDSVETYKSYIEKLKSLKPQPSQEWSEEDITFIDEIIGYFDGNELKHTVDEIIVYLSSLRYNIEYHLSSEKQQGWSEEDEDNIKTLIQVVRGQLRLSECRQEYIVNWLKSLKPSEKYTLADLEAEWKHGYDFAKKEMWKPSEEHMKALTYAMQVMNTDLSPIAARTYQGLQEIHQNLKKL